jgi:hypothetical protein
MGNTPDAIALSETSFAATGAVAEPKPAQEAIMQAMPQQRK